MTYPKIVAVSMTAAALAFAGGCANNRDTTDTSASRSATEFGGDAALTARVKTAIASDSGIGNAANINVNTYRGVVQLNGFVDSQDKIQRAISAARNVDGVRNVENNLQVKPSS
jgi:hyperosmotically inducible periplasmic protein